MNCCESFLRPHGKRTSARRVGILPDRAYARSGAGVLRAAKARDPGTGDSVFRGRSMARASGHRLASRIWTAHARRRIAGGPRHSSRQSGELVSLIATRQYACCCGRKVSATRNSSALSKTLVARRLTREQVRPSPLALAIAIAASRRCSRVIRGSQNAQLNSDGTSRSGAGAECALCPLSDFPPLRNEADHSEPTA